MGESRLFSFKFDHVLFVTRARDWLPERVHCNSNLNRSYRTLPAPPMSNNQSAEHDTSVILVTGSYDREIRFWEAWSGICSRTIPRTGETGVSTWCASLIDFFT